MDCSNGATPSPEGKGEPSMMQKMMEKMSTGEFSPAALCKKMMASAGTDADAAHGTPELRKLFGEWARAVEDELLASLKAKGPLDLTTLAGTLKVTPESALYLLGKLVRDGKATIGSIQATGGREATP